MIFDEMEDRPTPDEERADAWEFWHERANTLEAENLRLRSAQAWQDISTAPKDGTYVWVSNGFSQRIAFWMDGKEYEYQGSVGGGWRDLALAERCRGTADLMWAPTHWCRLPVPPNQMIADQHGGKS